MRGFLDGYYVGRPGTGGMSLGVGGATTHRIEVYRATFDRIEAVEVQDGAHASARPVEGGGLRQALVPRARIYSPEGRGRVFEGALTDVHLPDPRYAGKARRGEAIYGRLSGWATATIELPEPALEPEPASEAGASLHARAAAEAVEVVDAAADAGVPVTPSAEGLEAPAAAESSVEKVTATPTKANPSDEGVASGGNQVDGAASAHSTSLLLVGAIVVAVALAATASGAYAGIWLTLALPTLLFRRLFHGMLEDLVGVRGLAVALVLGQLAATVSVWAALRVGSCHPLAGWALVLGLGAVFLAGLLPWRAPLVVNGLAFALMLWPAALPRPETCRVDTNEPRSVHEPSAPRTNPDGSWPRRPQAF